MIKFGRALSLAVGGALASFSPASANTSPVAPSGFAPALEMVSVHDIQVQLLARGYDPGPASGVVNDETLRAILAFQRDYGLPQDGVAGPVVQNMLHFLPRRPPPAALAALTPPATMAPAPASVPEPLPTDPPVTAAPQAVAFPPPAAAPTTPSANAATAAAIVASAAGVAGTTTPSDPPPAPMRAAVDASAPPTAAPDAAPPAISASAATGSPAPSTVVMLAPILAPSQDGTPEEAPPHRGAKHTMEVPRGTLGPLDPKPIAAPRIPVAQGPAGTAASLRAAPAPGGAMTPAMPQDAAPFTGEEGVREAQLCLQRLGLYNGKIDGVMNWATVEALVKFDASGAGPKTVIADAQHPDAVWLARLRTAAADKGE